MQGLYTLTAQDADRGTGAGMHRLCEGTRPKVPRKQWLRHDTGSLLAFGTSQVTIGVSTATAAVIPMCQVGGSSGSLSVKANTVSTIPIADAMNLRASASFDSMIVPSSCGYLSGDFRRRRRDLPICRPKAIAVNTVVMIHAHINGS
jgi:hypothetical protein